MGRVTYKIDKKPGGVLRDANVEKVIVEHEGAPIVTICKHKPGLVIYLGNGGTIRAWVNRYGDRMYLEELERGTP